jgi:hypothetical protein
MEQTLHPISRNQNTIILRLSYFVSEELDVDKNGYRNGSSRNQKVGCKYLASSHEFMSTLVTFSGIVLNQEAARNLLSRG